MVVLNCRQAYLREKSVISYGLKFMVVLNYLL